MSLSLQLKEAEFCRQVISLLLVFTYNYNLISHMDSAIMFNSTAFCNAFHKDTRRFCDEETGKSKLTKLLRNNLNNATKGTSQKKEKKKENNL